MTTFKFKQVVYMALTRHHGPMKSRHRNIVDTVSGGRQPRRYRPRWLQCDRYIPLGPLRQVGGSTDHAQVGMD
jgi:hypothetical protein